MPTKEGRISGAILSRIRARNESRSGDGAPNSGSSHLVDAKSVVVREVGFSDFERVCALNLRLKQGPDSVENWSRLWIENPALADGKGTSPIGWVLEALGNVVGFLGTIPLQYEFEGIGLRAAATCRFAVEPAFRAFSHLLLMSFFRQKNVDLFLNTTATVEAGKMMVASKASPLPQPDYGTVLFWVLNHRQFTKEVFRKLGLNPSLSGPAVAIASLALRGDAAVRGRRPRAKHSDYLVREIALHEIGKEFDELWSSIARQTSRLLAKRTPEIMRWHFDPPNNWRKVTVLSCESNNHCVGYVIIRHDQETTEGVRRSLIADMMIRDDDSLILGQLMAAACQSAADSGSYVIEAMGFPQNIRHILMALKPYARKYPACPFFYKARDRKLHEKLANESVWYASPFDGDATLWP